MTGALPDWWLPRRLATSSAACTWCLSPTCWRDSGRIAGALAAVLDGPVVIEVRDAPLLPRCSAGRVPGPDGFPLLVREAGYKAFGVKLAGVPGEPDFLDYVPRDADQKLHDGLQAAQAGRRMLLVVGGSAGGKSRSAAEAARLHLPGHRLLCPRQTVARHGCAKLPVADSRACAGVAG